MIKRLLNYLKPSKLEVLGMILVLIIMFICHKIGVFL